MRQGKRERECDHAAKRPETRVFNEDRTHDHVWGWPISYIGTLATEVLGLECLFVYLLDPDLRGDGLSLVKQGKKTGDPCL